MRPSVVLPLLFLCFLHGARAAGSELELQILLELKNSLGITNAAKGFESWRPENSPCDFAGIQCNSNNSVSEIDLTGKGVSGTPPFASLCKLSSLTKLALGSNHLSGNLTADLRSCAGLNYLDLSFNGFTGPVPDLSPLNQLQVLNLSDNSFSGRFPWGSLGNLTGLKALSLGDNKALDESPFPEVVTNLTELTRLYLSDCNIRGEIPPSIGKLTELQDLELSDNFLSGEIPPEITRLSKLWQLELYNNSLTGKIPAGFGNLSNLALFDASMNNLGGDLSELRGLKNLISLQLFENGFSGEVPPEFGDFQHLVNLSLYSNRFSGRLPAKLGSWAKFIFIDVSTNFFTGEIPPDMCRMGTMKELLILENQFSGEIPATYANCTSLTRFRVSNNSLSGVVPTRLWSLPNVNIIDLAVNQLEGPIAAAIAEAKSLYQLFIANNRFSGELPPEIAGALSLVNIGASYNEFSGVVPTSIGGLKSLQSLDLEKNEFSGEIPESIGSCTALNTMNLAGNNLSGEIPTSIGTLPSLNSLDLSNNLLSGEIPTSLASLKFSFLNLSNNRLAGPVPAGLSIDAYRRSFAGNQGLCNAAASTDISFLRRCTTAASDSPAKLHAILASLLAGLALLIVAMVFVLFLKKRRSKLDDRDDILSRDSWNLKSFGILSFHEHEIIDSIKKENVIGKGGSGNVYRVELGSGKVVAVKHILNDPTAAADGGGEEKSTAAAMLPRRTASLRSKEFEAEVSTLSAIRHVNVVKLYCSITSEDSSLLVYEHLPNGSLWERLHEAEGAKLGSLDWDARYEIAVGAAKGLEYLHHGWDRPILHRDVKSSNILLDESFKPRIADFGLAKILRSAVSGGGDSSARVVAGTHGYIAPEYAYTWKVNEKSDVYSFGVVLMELVTGRRPIEAAYGENRDIVHWVSKRLSNWASVAGVLDERIPEWAREEAAKVLKVAVVCTARLPSMRPSMRMVAQMLEEARSFRPVTLVHGKEYY